MTARKAILSFLLPCAGIQCAFAMLPPGYEPLPCIVADGTQYLDTGYVPTSTNMGFYFDFQFNGSVSATDSVRLIGSSKLNDGKWGGFCITAYNTYSGGQMCFCRQQGFNNPGLVSGARMQLELKSMHYISSTGIDSMIGEANPNPSFSGSVYLGIVHTDGSQGGAEISQSRWLRGRIYHLKFYDGEDVVHDFVPVRTIDGRIGLYDVKGNLGLRVSATESPYIAGSLGVTFLEYVESTGTQFLDTGYTPADMDFGFDLDFRYDNEVATSGDYAQVLGSSQYNSGNWGGILVNGYASQPGGQLRFGYGNPVEDPGLVQGERIQISLRQKEYMSSTGKTNDFADAQTRFYGSVWLGKIHRESPNANTMKGRYYGFRLYDGNVVVRDYRPAKKDGVAGFYDTVYETFSASSAEEAFVAGPETRATCNLEVASSRDGVGSVSTGFIITNLLAETTFVCVARPDWTDESNNVKYVCRGWALKDASGSVIMADDNSRKFNHTLPTNEVQILEWNYVPSELPDGYCLLKHITSTGTQATDLGVAPGSGVRVVYDFRFTEVSSATRSLSGWGSGSSTDAYMWGHMEAASKGVVGVFSSSIGTNWVFASTGVALDTERHIFDLNDGLQFFDGNLYGTSLAVAVPNPEKSTAQQHLYAAALHGGWNGTTDGTTNGHMKSDIYGCRIYRGCTCIADFVPCRRTSDSVAGFYDVLSGSFKPSFIADTAFVAGPEAHPHPAGETGLIIIFR